MHAHTLSNAAVPLPSLHVGDMSNRWLTGVLSVHILMDSTALSLTSISSKAIQAPCWPWLRPCVDQDRLALLRL